MTAWVTSKGGSQKQDHHRRSKVYLPGTTPDLIFPRVLAERPVIYETERCRLRRSVVVGLDCPPQAFETCFGFRSVPDAGGPTTSDASSDPTLSHAHMVISTDCSGIFSSDADLSLTPAPEGQPMPSFGYSTDCSRICMFSHNPS